MHKEKLAFYHRNILYERLRKISVALSEYSFSNLYLFRDVHDYEIIFDREILIKGRTYDGFSYLMPTFDARKTDYSYLRTIAKDVDFLFPIPEEWVGLFDADEFEPSYNKGDMDYIYTVEKISKYKGRKLYKKRNLLRQFLSLYKHEDLPLTKERIGDAISVLNEWQKATGLAPEKTDYHPCLEALEMCEELILCGGIYYVDNEPAAFILGEELNSEVFAIHFAKGRKEFKGLYQYMYNNFAKILPEKYKYFNFEQDLGREALRVAKSSYAPDKMLKKFRVKLKLSS